jgi:NAD(P) transhydrogenase subunit alpha
VEKIVRIAVVKEALSGERRVALVPESVKKLVKAGIEVHVQAGAGVSSLISDKDYAEAGATVAADIRALLGQSDFVLKVHGPQQNAELGDHEAGAMKPGAILLATLRPTISLDSVRRLAAAKVTAFSTDCIPRITRAQSMDTLSSQATIAGYKAVIVAANELNKIFPMLMTAAGTLVATKVFVIGAGVAGLQAIASARRLGATVEATDTRPEVKEQIESVGAKFVGIQGGTEARDAGGYAKELSKDFYAKQAELIGERCAINDVVITTALIGGVKAPKLITEEMVQRMRAGSVIVDLAADGGGNCTLSEPGKTVVKHGVTICAPLNLASQVPLHASTMYSRNLTTFITTFWKDGKFNLDFNDEIIKGACVTHNGEVVHKPTKDAMTTGGTA